MLELDFTQTLGSHCLQIRETLPASGITAVFGVSGAGKTSLINAISGLTRPQAGRIVLNGRVLNDTAQRICLAPEQRRIGYVFQDARLFPHYKVRGNLQYGMAKSMVSQFDKLVDLLGIAPLLDRLPGRLSGGEKQRISIARAMLKNAPIVILDEATAYTDPENEAIIQESVARLVRGKTLIVIAHRLSTIVDADQIVVVNDGCIEATGTQAELLQACPLYETLWNAHIASRDSAEGGADRA